MFLKMLSIRWICREAF